MTRLISGRRAPQDRGSVGFRARRVEILKGVDLEVRRGDVFGLLGPNGAGKTTTLKVVLGLMRPTSGTVALGVPGSGRGRLPAREPVLLRLPVGARVPGLLRAAVRARRRRRGASASTAFSPTWALRRRGDAQLRKYSKGMLQRIGIAQALINDPELVLLDEPMTGLDPVGRVEVKRIIESLHERGKTVLFNSHILTDVPSCARASPSCATAGGLAGRGRRGAGRPADARGLLHGGGDGVNQLVADRRQHVQGDHPRPHARA